MSTIFTPPPGVSQTKQATSEPPVADLINLDFSPSEPLLSNDGAGHPCENNTPGR